MKTKKEKSEYDIQAEDFLKATKTTITKIYTGHRPYFSKEKKFRATYQIMLTREGHQPMTFDFGQSMANSWSFLAEPFNVFSGMFRPFNGLQWGTISLFDAFQEVITTGNDNDNERYLDHRGRPSVRESIRYVRRTGQKIRGFKIKKRMDPPSDYDILSSIEKYDPETFEDFCSNYGYDEDSRNAENIYQAVRKQYQELSRIYNNEEMDLLREIN